MEKAEDNPPTEWVNRDRPERGDDLPILEASTSVPAHSSEVTNESGPAKSGLKRPQGENAVNDEQPPTSRARLEALCSLVHGDLAKQSC